MVSQGVKEAKSLFAKCADSDSFHRRRGTAHGNPMCLLEENITKRENAVCKIKLKDMEKIRERKEQVGFGVKVSANDAVACGGVQRNRDTSRGAALAWT